MPIADARIIESVETAYVLAKSEIVGSADMAIIATIRPIITKAIKMIHTNSIVLKFIL